jgi:hypothetical protein
MRHPPDPVAVCVAIRDGDPDVMDRDQLAEHTRQIAALRAWCESQQTRVVRRQRALAVEGRAEHPKDLLVREGGQSGKEARAGDERERVCTAIPGFDDALAAGAVSAGHVDAIANATRGLDEPAQAEFVSHAEGLLADAERMGVDAFERNCRELARFVTAIAAGGSDADELQRQRAMSKVRRWTDRQTGMRYTQIALDPIRDARLWAAIDRARRNLRRSAGSGTVAWDQLQVDAVIAATATGDAGAAGSAGGGSELGVIVLVDHDTLQHGLHANSVCELSDGTPLPVSTIRQMACRAEIIPVVLDGNGRALDVGRSKRLATEAQRHALRAMYTTCAYPGCTVPFDSTEIHHIQPFEHGGTTDLSNLLPLCLIEGHHHQVHQGGWTLTMTPDRIITLTRPDGTEWFHGSTIDRAPAGVASSQEAAIVGYAMTG